MTTDEQTTSGRGTGNGLSARGLLFAYPAVGRTPARSALAGIDLDIPPDQTVALLGPNGSGKSTLIKIICGILAPDEGRIAIFGESPPVRSAFSVVFQFTGLDRHLTVYENLRDQAVLYGINRGEARKRIDRELTRAGLADRRHDLVKTLSRGLARRADLARAMLHRPRLLLLDEPTAGVDPPARQRFLEQLFEPRDDRPSIVLLSTHLVDEAERCDRVVLLHQGRIVADGHPAALCEAHLTAPGIRIRTTADPPSINGLTWDRSIVGFFTATTDDAELVQKATARLLASRVGFSISPSIAPTLAEVFERLTGAPLDDAQRRSDT